MFPESLGSVDCIEATISSSLCSGSLGVLSGDDALSADNQNEEAAVLGSALQGTLRLQDLQSSPTDIGADQGQQLPTSGQAVGEFGGSFWVDDMAGFPLPPLDLDPLPPGLFSPCSGTYKLVVIFTFPFPSFPRFSFFFSFCLSNEKRWLKRCLFDVDRCLFDHFLVSFLFFELSGLCTENDFILWKTVLDLYI